LGKAVISSGALVIQILLSHYKTADYNSSSEGYISAATANERKIKKSGLGEMSPLRAGFKSHLPHH